MAETLAHEYSSESTQRELSNEYQDDRVKVVSQKSLRSCPLDESSLSIGRVKVFFALRVEGSLSEVPGSNPSC